LGVNATTTPLSVTKPTPGFNGHPPLGVNATVLWVGYWWVLGLSFNGHPPLGVNATVHHKQTKSASSHNRFNGHPPLGVNATRCDSPVCPVRRRFQWAPTLGGECYLLWSSILREA